VPVAGVRHQRGTGLGGARKPGRKYHLHFRISATDANGTSVGSDATFKNAARAGPHWYANGVRLGETGLENGQSILAWGHLTLTNTKVGAFTCRRWLAGTSPTDRRRRRQRPFEGVTLFDCEEPPAKAPKGCRK